jgi:hypothetical protein
LYREVALIVKRSWFEETDQSRNEFFSSLMSALTSADASTRLLSLGIWSALIDEFSFRGASSLGLSLEFHERCRFAFQEQYLQPLFISLTAVLEQSITQELWDLAVQYVGLISDVMNWDFIENTTRAAYLRMADRGVKSATNATSMSTYAVLRPPRSWAPVLLNPSLVRVLWSANEGFLRSRSPTVVGASHKAREALCQIATVREDFFDDPTSHAAGQEAVGKYQHQLLDVAVRWCTSALSPTASSTMSEEVRGSVVYDACLLIYRSIVHFRIRNEAVSLLPSFRDITVAVLQGRTASYVSNEDSTWFADSFDLLLSAWGTIVSNYMTLVYMTSRPVKKEELFSELSQALPSSCWTIAEAYFSAQVQCGRADIQRELQGGQTRDLNEDEEEAQEVALEEELTTLSILARMNPSQATSWLLSALVHCTNTLVSAAGASIVDGTSTLMALEDMYWVITFAGHVLADDVEGETPSIAESIVSWASTIPSSDAFSCPLLTIPLRVKELSEWQLTGYLSQLAHQPLTFSISHPPVPQVATVISPRLSARISAFFSRWVSCFLLPSLEDMCGLSVSEAQIRNSLLAVLCEPSQPLLDLVESLLLRILFSLKLEGSEHVACESACMLLQRLASRTSVASVLIKSPTFWTIVSHVSSSTDLPLDVQRRLFRSFVDALSTTGSMGDVQAATQQCLSQLLNEVQTLLFRELQLNPQDLSAPCPNPQFAQHPATKNRVCSVLERLRGISHGVNIFQYVHQLLPTIAVQLVRTYSDSVDVVQLIVVFWKEFCQAQVSFLEGAEYIYTANAVLRMLQTIRDINLGKRYVNVEAAADDADLLLHLVDVVMQLANKFYMDLSANSESDAMESATINVIFEAFSLLLPLLQQSQFKFLLEYPELAGRFFELLNQTLDVHADELSRISPPLFQALLDCVHCALSIPSNLIVTNSLDALFLLLKQHVQKGVLAVQIQAHPDTFRRSAKHLLRWAFYEDLDQAAVRPLSDALLGLLIADRSGFQEVIHEIVQGFSGTSNYDRLCAAFGGLLAATPSLDKDSRAAFRISVGTLLDQVRACVRVN